MSVIFSEKSLIFLQTLLFRLRYWTPNRDSYYFSTGIFLNLSSGKPCVDSCLTPDPAHTDNVHYFGKLKPRNRPDAFMDVVCKTCNDIILCKMRIVPHRKRIVNFNLIKTFKEDIRSIRWYAQRAGFNANNRLKRASLAPARKLTQRESEGLYETHLQKRQEVIP